MEVDRKAGVAGGAELRLLHRRLDPFEDLERQRNQDDAWPTVFEQHREFVDEQVCDGSARSVGRAADASAEIPNSHGAVQGVVEHELGLEHRVASEAGKSGNRLRNLVSLPAIGSRQRSSQLRNAKIVSFVPDQCRLDQFAAQEVACSSGP